MRTRDNDIVRLETQGSDKSSKTWDLKYTDPISALWLEFWATNGTTSNKGNFISDIITKIEVVDGSKPLISLNMFELEFLHWLKTGKTPGLFPSEHGSGNQRHGALLLFGRHLWDREFAFNSKAYKNPQLKISWDLGAVRVVSATTAFATGTLAITACAKIMEDVSVPGSFLSQRQVDTFTMPTSGTKKIEMYTDYPWRLALVRCYLQGRDIDEMIERLTLDCDSAKFKPIDNRYVRDLDSEALGRFGRSQLKHDVFVADRIEFRELNNKENSSTVKCFEDDTGITANIRYEWSSGAKLDLWNTAGARVSSDTKLTLKEDGHALHAILPIPFGIMDAPDSWLNAPEYAKIDLNLYVPSGGGYAGISSVVLEQPRPNGE